MQQRVKMMINLNKNKKLRPLLISLYISTGKGALYIIVKIQIFKLWSSGHSRTEEGGNSQRISRRTFPVLMLKEPIKCQAEFFFSSKNTTKYHNHQEQNLYI